MFKGLGQRLGRRLGRMRGGAARALRRDGAVPIGRLRVVPAGPAECARLALPPVPVAGGVVAVAVRLWAGRDGVTIRIGDAAGTIHDHLHAPPRDTPYDVALFAPAGTGLDLRIGHITPQSTADLLSAEAFLLPEEALAPARLMPQPRPGDRAAWPRDPYGAAAAEDAAGRLRDRVFHGLRGPAAVPWLDRLTLLLEPEDEQSHCLLRSGVYEPDAMWIVRRRLRPGDTFVDVGAHCGLYTLMAARRVGMAGRVHAIEPSAREFARLKAHVEINGLTQVRLHPLAATDYAGVAALRVAGRRFGGHNTLGPRFAYDLVDTAGVEQVPTAPLDALLAAEGRCDLIKLDIEGAEPAALRGAEATLARFRPALLIEMNAGALAASGASVGELVGWLAARGYDLARIDPRSGETSPVGVLPDDVNANFLALP